MTTASAPRKLHPKKQSSQNAPLCKEKKRLIAREKEEPEWSRWGPYLSERQWGTVREDYSPHGEAWEYFSHDHARSRAYRWGEDGLRRHRTAPHRELPAEFQTDPRIAGVPIGTFVLYVLLWVPFLVLSSNPRGILENSSARSQPPVVSKPHRQR